MLSPKTQTNLANAQSYFEEHLCVGDYYTESERVFGEWLGIGAASLGLSGVVEQRHFIALCENRNPRTGERLTVRQKTTRRDGGREVANRRVFYGFTLSPPKSVSVAALVGGDERIITAHAGAVRIAMQELERFAATQVAVGNERRDRATGNMVGALFQGDTSRTPDPADIPAIHPRLRRTILRLSGENSKTRPLPNAASRAATNAAQYYVTISRGRKSIRIFTTDKAQLAANSERTGNRALSLDVFKQPARNLVREQLLRGVKLGRDFARRVCMAIATRWAPVAKRAGRESISQ